ncbi:MAG TPA: hypothetical protein VFC05_15865, partial [Nitrososphaeraceae archaeon]|nr:hypothetical protein [Nitrososphaeraceae archaeon]
MHRASVTPIITFILMAASVIMLLSFANTTNLFSNTVAMAQGSDADNSYSSYPTNDKKYECRTGPFEGFFVSSVEFCKFNKFNDKDDDRKDHSRDNNNNSTGTQGPPGPQGPIGPQGPQGLPGPQG